MLTPPKLAGTCHSIQKALYSSRAQAGVLLSSHSALMDPSSQSYQEKPA